MLIYSKIYYYIFTYASLLFSMTYIYGLVENWKHMKVEGIYIEITISRAKLKFTYLIFNKFDFQFTSQIENKILRAKLNIIQSRYYLLNIKEIYVV